MDEMIAKYEREMYPMKKGVAVCPTCGGELEEDDCFDHEYNGDSMERLVYGHCPYCGNSYQWREVFFFGGHSKIEKTED